MPEGLFWGHKMSNLTLGFEDNYGSVSKMSVKILEELTTRGVKACASRGDFLS